jgi:hypothetical protein
MPNGFDPNTDTLRPIPDPASLEGFTAPTILPTITGLQGLTPTAVSAGGGDPGDTVIDGGGPGD